MNVVKEKNKKNKELVERHEIENSPFTVIKTENDVFGTMGKYRITEPYDSIEECEKALKEFSWNRVMQVVMLLVEELTPRKDEA